MTRIEHLLTCLAEECSEVAHCASKALRFGVNHLEHGHDRTATQRMAIEINDFLAVMGMLADAGLDLSAVGDKQAMIAKQQRVEKFLRYSAECGTLSDTDSRR